MLNIYIFAKINANFSNQKNNKNIKQIKEANSEVTCLPSKSIDIKEVSAGL